MSDSESMPSTSKESSRMKTYRNKERSDNEPIASTSKQASRMNTYRNKERSDTDPVPSTSKQAFSKNTTRYKERSDTEPTPSTSKQASRMNTYGNKESSDIDPVPSTSKQASRKHITEKKESRDTEPVPSKSKQAFSMNTTRNKERCDTEPVPSTSKQAYRVKTSFEDEESTSDDELPVAVDDDELYIENEEAEIAKLKLSSKDFKSKPPVRDEDDEREPKIRFRCSACDMDEMVHIFGKTAPFILGVEYYEDTYVMRDPFQPPPPRNKKIPEYYIAMGANCSQCQRPVCKDEACSFYYTRTFCLDCAKKIFNKFPVEVQTKLSKQLSSEAK
ncbi:flocculation protein FLO11-like [Teleopsis dalmanni]|uniref:flocculation protein FLO11-like n=1 Tax=Teleopsis dalmanni TaxID=139649 RepID=UPI0018CF4EEB|nr:flocculation protein FLO11-like [Teleopsis dalmanni]XP_037951070.1 flocculation protein FLO11-like [Teleopsis dalmanni]